MSKLTSSEQDMMRLYSVIVSEFPNFTTENAIAMCQAMATVAVVVSLEDLRGLIHSIATRKQHPWDGVSP